jgi:hypothetical protein
LENPFRSVERVVPPDDGQDDGDDNSRHYIDRISLLRTPPEREGGVVHYDREQGILGCCGTGRTLLRLCYARDTGPLREATMPLPTAPLGAVDDDESLGSAGEQRPPGAEPPEDEDTMTDEPSPPLEPPAGELGEEPGGGGGMPSTVGEMTPQDFFEGFAHVLRLVLDEKAGEMEGGPPPEEGAAPPAGMAPPPPGAPPPGPPGKSVPYQKEVPNAHKDEMAIAHEILEDPHHVPYGHDCDIATPGAKRVDAVPPVKEERIPYNAGAGGMSQAGGSNTMIPSNKGIGAAKPSDRRQYEKETNNLVATPTAPAGRPANGVTHTDLKNMISRVQYAKDKGETDEILTYLYTELTNMQLGGRRVVYSQNLHTLRDLEGVDLSDEAIEKLVAKVTDSTPEGYEAEKLAEIREHYSRRAVNVPRIPVGLPPFATLPGATPGLANPDEVRQATALRMQSEGKMSYADALAAVRAK